MYRCYPAGSTTILYTDLTINKNTDNTRHQKAIQNGIKISKINTRGYKNDCGVRGGGIVQEELPQIHEPALHQIIKRTI